MGKRVSASDYHGKDGFGEVPDLSAPGLEFAQTEHAIQALVRLVDQYQGMWLVEWFENKSKQRRARPPKHVNK